MCQVLACRLIVDYGSDCVDRLTSVHPAVPINSANRSSTILGSCKIPCISDSIRKSHTLSATIRECCVIPKSLLRAAVRFGACFQFCSFSLLVPYRITLLSNYVQRRRSACSVLAPYRITLLSNVGSPHLSGASVLAPYRITLRVQIRIISNRRLADCTMCATERLSSGGLFIKQVSRNKNYGSCHAKVANNKGMYLNWCIPFCCVRCSFCSSTYKRAMPQN